MEPLNHKEEQKTEALEQAVFKCSPEEITELYKKRKKAKYTARALGFACRYRGLDMVKALVETGASFTHFTIRLRNANGYIQGNSELDYSEALLRSSPLLKKDGFYEIAEKAGLTVVPLDERLRILDYLCENAKSVFFNPNTFLMRTALSNDREMVELLKSRGALVPEYMIFDVIGRDERPKNPIFTEYSIDIPDEEFIPYAELVNSLLGGKKIKADPWEPSMRLQRCTSLKFAEFLFKNYEFDSLHNNVRVLEDLINSNKPEMLALALENGLIKHPVLADRMIGYSVKQGMTACTACLLDFKNRNFDIAAERKATEKKLTLDDKFDTDNKD